MSIAVRVVAKYQQAKSTTRSAPVADKIKKLPLLELRRAIRDVQPDLAKLKENYSEAGGFPGSSDPHVARLKEELEELDHKIGGTMQTVDVLSKKLEDFAKRT